MATKERNDSKRVGAKRIASWEVTDAFWERVSPYVPVRERPAGQEYLRKAGGGRKPKPPRLVFEAIVYVLRTGCQWKALPKERFGSASAVHKRFLEWEEAGVFDAIWAAGLAEYDEMEGIAWRWQSVDGAMFKAPLAQEQTGPNPTDRGKKRQQAASSGGRTWRPLVARRDRSEPA
jgi:transposase